MAQIRQNKKQLQALQDITDALARVQSARDLLTATGGKGFQICNVGARGKGKIFVSVPDELVDKQIGILEKIITSNVKYVQKIAKQYDIDLSPEDLKLLDGVQEAGDGEKDGDDEGVEQVVLDSNETEGQGSLVDGEGEIQQPATQDTQSEYDTSNNGDGDTPSVEGEDDGANAGDENQYPSWGGDNSSSYGHPNFGF